MNTIGDFIGAVKTRQMDISSSLANGGAINFETYQRLVGQHQGLEEALDILNNLLKEGKNDD